MKLFSVTLNINLVEIGDAEEPKPHESTEALADQFPSDSPLKDVGKLFDHLQKRGVFPGSMVTPGGFPGMSDGDSMAMHHTFKVIVGSFEEMQAVLAKFRDVADKLTMPVDH